MDAKCRLTILKFTLFSLLPKYSLLKLLMKIRKAYILQGSLRVTWLVYM